MLQNADMVPKECRFNQSGTVYRLCMTQSMRVYNGKSGELIQMQHFCHHRDTICHTNSSYQTVRNIYMWMQQ